MKEKNFLVNSKNGCTFAPDLKEKSAGVLALALLPAFAGVLLHVGHLVALFDNLEAEDCLDDILEGEDALEGAELVDDAGNLLLVLQEVVPDVG